MNAPPQPRLLTGAEGLMIHGVGKDIVERAHEEGFSNTTMLDLAGNCFAATIPASIDLAIIANLTESHIAMLQKGTTPKPPKTQQKLDDEGVETRNEMEQTTTEVEATQEVDADIDGIVHMMI